MDVIEALNAAGYRPSARARRARFTRDSVRSMLADRCSIGELPVGKRGKDGWVKAAHEPFVPLELFEAVQRERQQRTKTPDPCRVPRGLPVHALSGLVRCAEGRVGVKPRKDLTATPPSWL